MMKKIFLFLSLSFLVANDLEQALEYEKKGAYKQAMEIYKKLALEKREKQNTSFTQKTSDLKDSEQNSKLQNEKFSHTALTNYLGEETIFNPLGISAYKMNYFLPFSHNFKKNADTETKFQISLKKRVFENLLGLDEKYYFAYTQTSWWELYKHSAPFRESSYQPEIFVDFPLKRNFLHSLRFGFLHESNGKGEGFGSRSWNRIYLSSIIFYDKFIIVPRIWFRIPEKAEDDDNKDIVRYTGNFDLNLVYLKKGFFANLLLRNNLERHNRSSLQVDLGYDLFGNGIFWYVQYFNGYAESLIDYNKHSNRLSTGILIAY